MLYTVSLLDLLLIRLLIRGQHNLRSVSANLVRAE